MSTEELKLVLLHGCKNRLETIGNISSLRMELEEDETRLYQLCTSTIDKLQNRTDEQYYKIITNVTIDI